MVRRRFAASAPARLGVVFSSLAVLIAVCVVQAPLASATEGWSWSQVSVEHGKPLTSVDCPTSTFCVAVDNAAHVLVSTDPFDADPTWTTTSIIGDLDEVGGAGGLTAVSCVGTSLCVVTDGAADTFTSLDPTASNATWTIDQSVDTGEPGASTADVSCASASFCTIDNGANGALNSSDPGDASPAWSFAFDAGGSGNGAVSCPSDSATFCVLVNYGQVATMTNPATDSNSRWTDTDTPDTGTTRADTTQLFGLSCPTSSFCVADDAAGNVLSSSNPGSASPTYTLHHVDGANSMRGVSCASTSFCAANDTAGNVLTSDDASDVSPAWTVTSVETGHQLNDVSCASSTQCLAVDSFGDVFEGVFGTVNPLTVTPAGSGSGTVTSTAGGISCSKAAGSTCSANFASGGSVTLTATPASGSAFEGFTGGGCGADSTCTVTMSAAQAVTATFAIPPPAPHVSAPTNGTSYTPSTVPHAKYSCTAAGGATLPGGVDGCRATIDGTEALAVGSAPSDAIGSHTIVVTAEDTDLQTTSTTVRYTVHAAKVTVSEAKVRAESASLSVGCPPGARACVVSLALTTATGSGHKRHTVKVGAKSTKVAAGATKRLTVSLNAKGRALLRKGHSLKVILGVKVTQATKETTHSQKLTFKTTQGH